MFVLETPQKTFIVSETHRADHRTVSQVHRDFAYQKIVYVDQWKGRWTQADANSPIVTNTSGDWEKLL
jgi:hypothetical protein